MNSERAQAYGRLMRTIREDGPAALDPSESALVREAADALLFCRDLEEPDVRHALGAVTVLTDDLIDAERWTPRRAQQLLDDIRARGPDATADVPMAA
jgi:hypothetical protein